MEGWFENWFLTPFASRFTLCTGRRWRAASDKVRIYMSIYLFLDKAEGRGRLPPIGNTNRDSD
jgi:hypothetical protein